MHTNYFYKHETLLIRFGSFTWYILALVRVLPLTAMLEIIYLKPELQSTKHNLMQANSG